jgi:phosphoribosylaminoimidazolecarboxamide formyltransferase / IMP cyclohydrolase
VPIERALISVSDKTNVVNLARVLTEDFGVEVLSTGGTAKSLREAGIAVTEVSDFTGSPEMMQGRVKTLHPDVHGGILVRRNNTDDQALIAAGDVRPIDLVAVNLYPFRETVAKPDVTIEDAIENIDIGGPTMIRSAAKNHAHVAVLTDPGDYDGFLAELAETSNNISEETRQKLAVKAFRHTASYDAAIDTFLSPKLADEIVFHQHYVEGKELRYGENSHQTPAFAFIDPASTETSAATARILHGKDMSYNNFVDANSALAMVKDLAGSVAVSVIKHNNPAGIATGQTLAEALERGWNGDPLRTTAMGSVIATTVRFDLAAAQFLKGRFVEVLLAPGYDDDALDFLRNKSKDIRLLEIDPVDAGDPDTFVTKSIVGGLMVQPPDNELIDDWKVVTKRSFDASQEKLAAFAYVAVKHTRSNGVILAREYKPGFFQLVGLGAGQPNRVDSLRALAAPKARANFETEYDENKPSGTKEDYVAAQFGELILASDAFFPFDDTVREAAEFGVQYIVQPGGAKYDTDVIAAADELGIAMAFTGRRHFTH